MSEERIIKNQTGEENRQGSSDNMAESGVTRRDFIQKTVAVASGLALSSFLPTFPWELHAEALPAACQTGQDLQPIMEIKRSSATQTLQAVLKVVNENKSYLAAASGSPACNSGQMRYFSGYDRTNPGQVWPNSFPNMIGGPTPGPTFRARVGDTVQITLLNQVDVSKFGNTLDVAETGGGCDVAKSVGADGIAVNTYPGDPSFEHPPDCFHGSSSTNLHFHGTHVSPNSIADYVLANVRPSPIDKATGKPVVDEKFVEPAFSEIFKNCSHGHSPQLWTDLPKDWQDKQQKLLKNYDLTAPWKGVNGPVNGKPALPLDEQLWPKDEKAINDKQWPQYYVGAYPSCFQIPTWPTFNGKPMNMGQAPGTHWYHAHKHGSTALNLANGMAGALIIEGDYDDVLKRFFTKQQVLVLQQYGAQLNLLKNGINDQGQANANLGGDLVFVNGQFTPLLHMNPNEMQLWRIVNACHRAQIALNAPTGIKWVQTAQDGVQFDPRNYNPGVTNASFPVPATANPLSGSLAPGNRIDLLVQAPSSPGTYQVTFGSKTLFTVSVTQDPIVPSIPNPMPFPTQAQFPAMPGFLSDINPADVRVRRELHFKSTPDPTMKGKMGRGTNLPYPPPKHTIDGKQFDNTIDQTMMLGATEEWTLYNDGGAAHPFHIHINPFQVVEIFDPTKNNGKPFALPRPWIWWDDFAIPPGGYFKMLSRFVDFTGIYVLHCHILGHEDRGMMQLVQVVTNTTNVTHH